MSLRLLFTDSVNQSSFKEIQLLKTAVIYDSRYGEVKITREMLDQMVKNFQEKVRGIEIMLDAGHNSDKEAYGWFKNLYTKEGDNNSYELWGSVELTSLGQKALTEKLYGYISADFHTSYQDNETLATYGAVLLGAGLTNRPVVKGMSPAIALSENNQQSMEIKMDLQQLLDACGVSSPEELIKMIGDMKSQIEMACATETELKEQIAMSEKTNGFNALLSEGKACEAQRESFMKGDMVAFAKNAQPVKLSEVSSGSAEGNEKTAEEQIMELAESKMKEEKIGMAKAISIVLSENKELAKQYRKGE